jgi:drug/metabolite transporter (DMT)-like permease
MIPTRWRAYGGVALSAALFGAAFPLSKRLLAEVHPLGLAGLLYLGSGLGIGAVRVFLRARGRSTREARLTRSDSGWLAGVILAGGVAGPILLLMGLDRTPAHVGALLANTETLFTVVIALLFFGDFLTRREITGAAVIVTGATLVGWSSAAQGGSIHWAGPLCLLASGLAWGLDNNFTQRLSGRDPLEIAAVKGIAAGLVNLGLAKIAGAWPDIGLKTAAFALLVGSFSYGLSMVLFIVGLRHLGAARTSALFATAPAAAVVLSWALLGEVPATLTALGGAFLIPGTWLFIRDQHAHFHVHDVLEHEHRHLHDEHHAHEHRGDEGPEPHSHRHRHEKLEHEHPHVSDLHHRHGH